MLIQLEKPSVELADSYVSALRNEYSPNNLSPEKTARREIDELTSDPRAFIASIDGTNCPNESFEFIRSKGGRLPGFRRWLTRDGNFLGSFALRWVPHGGDLPATVPGHVGYSIVPWERNKGHGTYGLRALLLEASELDMDYVELSIEASNRASCAVAEACRGSIHSILNESIFYPGRVEYRYRIKLPYNQH